MCTNCTYQVLRGYGNQHKLLWLHVRYADPITIRLTGTSPRKPVIPYAVVFREVSLAKLESRCLPVCSTYMCSLDIFVALDVSGPGWISRAAVVVELVKHIDFRRMRLVVALVSSADTILITDAVDDLMEDELNQTSVSSTSCQDLAAGEFASRLAHAGLTVDRFSRSCSAFVSRTRMYCSFPLPVELGGNVGSICPASCGRCTGSTSWDKVDLNEATPGALAKRKQRTIEAITQQVARADHSPTNASTIIHAVNSIDQTMFRADRPRARFHGPKQTAMLVVSAYRSTAEGNDQGSARIGIRSWYSAAHPLSTASAVLELAATVLCCQELPPSTPPVLVPTQGPGEASTPSQSGLPTVSPSPGTQPPSCKCACSRSSSCSPCFYVPRSMCMQHYHNCFDVFGGSSYRRHMPMPYVRRRKYYHKYSTIHCNGQNRTGAMYGSEVYISEPHWY